MAASEQIRLGEHTVTVKELSVADVRNWVAENEAGATVDPLRSLVFDDCSLDDLARMCDMPAEVMEKFGPLELAPLREKCKAFNPHFFKVREALTGVSRAIQAGLDSLSSTAQSAP
ncbi:MAG: hypothetical protein KBE22_03210 [Candidatus Accumulibacter sp.]|nr:hypothetical protein [Azonexus sp.]MBP9803903.1 hypothetical protein [Accumulibacter sp.]